MKVTKCSVCNSPIEYKTKPPTKCVKCRAKPKLFKSTGISKGENLMFSILNNVLEGDYINNGYYSWLMSPHKSPMQLDRYYPDYKLAWEFQGSQHYLFSKYFHKSKERFRYQQECDALKARRCADKGVTLICIKYDKKLSYQYLLSKIKDMNEELYISLVKRGLLTQHC